MQASQFSPEAFLDATVTEPTIRRPPLDPEVYSAIIGEPKVRAWQGKKDPSKSGIAVDIVLEIEVPESQRARIGQPKVVLMDSIMLDLNESGSIDNSPGKNRKMRQYREAVGLNKPGDVFNFRMLQSRMLKVKVVHEIFEGDTLDKVDAVAKA